MRGRTCAFIFDKTVAATKPAPQDGGQRPFPLCAGAMHAEIICQELNANVVGEQIGSVT
jgi:hypothetical protein